VTVIEKISESNYPELEIKCSASDTIGATKAKIHDILEKPAAMFRVQMAFKGRHLSDDTLTMASCDIVPAEHRPIPKIFVTVKTLRSAASASAVRTESESAPQSAAGTVLNERPGSATETVVAADGRLDDVVDLQYQDLTGNEEEHKQCRLCFSSEEDSALLGRLFSPCRCSGTMKWIHVQCLNEWRAVAPNARSYYRCDQCHYEYNLRRAEWARYVEHPATSKVISALLLSAGVLVLGLLSFKLPLTDFVWRNIEWSPLHFCAHIDCEGGNADCDRQCNSWLPWTECPRHCHPCFYRALDEWTAMGIEIASSGVLCLSVLGLFVQRQLIWRHCWVFVATLAQSARVWRLYLLVGIGHSFYSLLARVRVVVKRFLFHFGEKILGVDQTEQHPDE